MYAFSEKKKRDIYSSIKREFYYTKQTNEINKTSVANPKYQIHERRGHTVSFTFCIKHNIR